MAAGMRQSFLAFCDSQRKGADKASDKVMKKLFTDCGVFNLLHASVTDMDIALAGFKAKHKVRGDINYAQFCVFLHHFCQEAEAKAQVDNAAAAEAQLHSLIANGRPQLRGATSVSKDATTARLTNVSTYTGSHRERFNPETGEGRGKEGREYLPDPNAADGYVSGYRNKGNYDAKS